MPGDVLVYVEHDNGKPSRASLEASSKAARLGAEVSAVALGAGAEQTASALSEYGVDRLYYADDGAFDEYLAEPHAAALTHLVDTIHPGTVLLPNTPDGRDIAGRLSTRLNAGEVANVIDVVPDADHLDARETIFGGNVTTTVEAQGSPVAIFLIRPNAFGLQASQKQGSVQKLDFQPDSAALRARKGKLVQEEGAPTPLEEASIIVSGGRGLGGPEPFEMLQQLADALGGVVGASRAAVDAGWISYPHQVGQTGRTVKPNLYLAIGISGAVQHRVGMQTADNIVAINRDGDAPIFELADLGVVGDLFAIVPALTEEIRRRKGA